ncbi:MAG: thermitase [Candidatus Omnitrophota bacterium]|jgi:thermitase
MKISHLIACGLLTLAGISDGFAQTVILKDAKVSIEANDHELTDVLAAFARYGIEVNIDPGIKAKVKGRVVDADLEDELDRLLSGYGHVTKWEMVEGPLGAFPRLARIDVYRVGYHHKLQPILKDGQLFEVMVGPDGVAYAKNEFLIGMKKGTTLAQFKNLLASVNGAVADSIPGRGVYRIKLPEGSNVPAVIAQLENHPNVSAVEPNYVTDTGEPGQTLVSENPDAGAKTVTPLLAKEGASLVAVLDTGLSADVPMGDLIKGSLDATQPGTPIADSSGHGTQMAMIASGMIQPSSAHASDAQGIPLVAIKAFDAEGNTTNFSIMESIAYAQEQNARVLSLSWGSPTDSRFLEDAIDAAREANMFVVAAAGNEPDGQVIYPAGYDGVIAVAALGQDGSLWENSNYGSFVDLAAPGHAEFPVGHNGPAGYYAGTSIATAYVAGAISRYLTAHPAATEAQVMQALNGSLTDAGPDGTDSRYGKGVLDDAAMQKFLGTSNP